MNSEDRQPNMMMTVPFFGVTNMETSLEFYIRLGFKIASEWKPISKIEWCWITRDQIAIMLQEPRNRNHPLHHSMTKGFGISTCIQCVDALVLYQEFRAKGLEPTQPFVSNNRWTFSIADPDGYRLEFSNPTEVPEGTEYVEG